MSKSITDTLREQAKDILSEESLNEIETAFNSAVEERASLQVEAALVQQDEDHAAKVGELLEAIDNDHTAKLERIVEAIDSDRANKLKMVVSKYETALREGAGTFKESVISKVSSFLDLYLEKTYPTDMLTEAVANKRAVNVLKEMRQVLGVDMALAKDTIKDAVLDGKIQIDEANKKLDAAATENKQLSEKVTKMEARIALESKISDLSADKRKYAVHVLSDKSAEFINENFEYTMNLFDKDAQLVLENLKAEATRDAVSADRPIVEMVDPENTPIIQESNDDGPMFNHYMGELSKY